MNRSSSFLLAMVLLFGQAALLGHEYDFAAHASGDTCVICLHATPLSHAAVGASALALPLSGLDAEFLLPVPRIPAVAALAYRARAPPFAAAV